MWTANASQDSLDLQGAKDYCENLDYAGFSDWRLPDIAELESAVIITLHIRNARDPNTNPGFDLAADTTLPHGAFRWSEAFILTAWSNTPAGPGEAFSMNLGDNPLTGSSRITAKGGHYAFCTRNMESDLLQMAKEANTQAAVLDARELQIYVWLGRSQAAMAVGNYPGAVEAAKQALLLSPNSFMVSNILARAYTSQGQWNQAISAYQAVPDNRYLKSELKRIASLQKKASNDPNAVTAVGYISQSEALMEQGKKSRKPLLHRRAAPTKLEPSVVEEATWSTRHGPEEPGSVDRCSRHLANSPKAGQEQPLCRKGIRLRQLESAPFGHNTES